MRVIYFLALMVAIVSAGPCQKSETKKPKTLSTASLFKGDHLEISGEFSSFMLRSAEDVSLLSKEAAEKFESVDWTKEDVVGVAKQVPTGGYELSITRVDLDPSGKSINVYWALDTPPEDSITTMVISQPHEFITVEKQDPTVVPNFIQE